MFDKDVTKTEASGRTGGKCDGASSRRSKAALLEKEAGWFNGEALALFQRKVAERKDIGNGRPEYSKIRQKGVTTSA